MSRRRARRESAVAAARSRHPTAWWAPDLDELRARAAARSDAAQASGAAPKAESKRSHQMTTEANRETSTSSGTS